MHSTIKHVFGISIVFLLLLGLSHQIRAETQCPTFSHEQDILIRKAFAIGNEDDLGYSLAAIVWRESIVGRYIVRVNGPDGSLGSFGVAHMQLATAMWLEGVNSRWEAKATLAPKMINDDVYALTLSRNYLKSHLDLGWRQALARYNGKGPAARAYGQDIVKKVKVLQRCLDKTWS